MKIAITEVGLRDGIQSESRRVPTEDKVRLLDRVAEAGVRFIEATSFVSPRAVPQMADADEVVPRLARRAGVEISALVPNARGFDRARRAKIDVATVFISASETHNRKNLGRSVAESMKDVAAVAELAAPAGIEIKGTISTAFGCPFEGDVAVGSVVAIAKHYRSLGVKRLALGDTTGMATPRIVRAVCAALREAVPGMHMGLHFHNTRGLAMVNVAAGLELGIDAYESSIGGTGGCPFAPGATGNICTEDLVHYLHQEGHETGVDLAKITAAALELEQVLAHPLVGQVMRAGPRERRYGTDSVPTASGR
jgi:hydroxymethylglutaryl-CoA lyase